MAQPIKIRILGDATSFKKALSSSQKGMDKFRGGVTKVAKFGGLALAGLGVAAIKFAGDFDASRKSIAVATGATGEDLDALFSEFKDVLETVPGPMIDVAEATGAVSTQLGLTGDALEDVTRLGVEFGQVLDVNIGETTDNAARVMNQFGIEAADADDFFGDLLVTTQDYGVDADKLLADLEKMGPALQAVGFSAEGAAAFLGEANKAGVDVTRLKSPLLQFANAAIKAGEDPAEAFGKFAAKAAGITDSVELLALANETFGTTGGAAIAELIEAGVPLESLNDLLGDNAGSVSDAAEQTRTWTQKLDILKNKVLVKIEPVLAGVTDALESFAGFLEDDVIPAIKTGIRFFQNFGENFRKHKPIIIGVAVALSAIVIPAFILLGIAIFGAVAPIILIAAPIIALVAGLGLLAAGLVWAYENVEIFREIVDASFAIVKVVVENAVKVVVGQIESVIEIGQGVIDFFRGVFTGDFGLAWDGIVQIVTGAVDLVLAPIRGLISTAKALWDLGFLQEVAGKAVDGVVGFFVDLPGRMLDALDAIKGAAADIGASVLDGIADGISGALGFAGDIASQVGRAIKRFINTEVIDRFNRAVEFKIGLPFGKSFTINPPDIPHLAGGGPFSGLAIVGDSAIGGARPELVRGTGTVLSNTETRGRFGSAGSMGGPLVGTLIVNNGTPGEVLQMLRMARRVSAQ